MLRGMLPIVIVAAASACTKKAPPSQPANTASSALAKPTDDQRPAGPADDDAWPAGIDLGKLDAFKHKVFDQVVNREPSACGKGHSLLHSVKRDSACRASFYAVRYVARLADAGFSESEIGEKLSQRFRVPHVPYIDVSQAPSKGRARSRPRVLLRATFCRRFREPIHAELSIGRLSWTEDIEPEGGGSAGLDLVVGENAAQTNGLHGRQVQPVEGSAVN